jgi:AcrR family transcriptional regulator
MDGKGRDRILDIVVELIETEGYDAVQLREVARRARTSLATIYKRYGTRDELILAALNCWMEENRYAGLTKPHDPGESIYIGVMRVLRTIFEPWEQHPAMLKAYFRARTAPGGKCSPTPTLNSFAIWTPSFLTSRTDYSDASR